MDGVLTPEELKRELAGLSDGQKALLLRHADLHAAGTDFAPEDLLSEAVTRALTDKRHCPRGLKVTTFLINAMKSIGSHRRKELMALPTHESLQTEKVGEIGEEDVVPGTVHLLHPDPAPQEITELDGLAHWIEKRFAEDPIVLEALKARVVGFSTAKTCELLGVTPQSYEAAVTRLRRAVTKEYGR